MIAILEGAGAGGEILDGAADKLAEADAATDAKMKDVREAIAAIRRRVARGLLPSRRTKGVPLQAAPPRHPTSPTGSL